MEPKTVIGIYGHESSCLKYIEENLPKFINSQYTRVAQYSGSTIETCDVYVVSMQLDNAVDIIKQIRERCQDAIIIACCYDHDIEMLKQIVRHRVDSICEFDGVDVVKETLSGLESKIKENNLKNQLRLYLKKAEKTLVKIKRDPDSAPDLADESMRLAALT